MIACTHSITEQHFGSPRCIACGKRLKPYQPAMQRQATAATGRVQEPDDKVPTIRAADPRETKA